MDLIAQPRDIVKTALLRRMRTAGWREFVLLVTLATLGTGIWVFVEVADEVLEGEFHEREETFIRSLRHADDQSRPIGPAWAEEVGRDLTALGGVAVLTLLIMLATGYLLLARKHRAALLLVVATTGGLVLSTVLKNSFGRGRPDVVPQLSHVSTASFPSGHSMLSSVTYLTLGALLARTVVRRRLKMYFVGTALLLSALVGVSRVYLGVHYPTDVIAGWAAGAAWASLIWLAATWLQSRGVVEHESDVGTIDPGTP